MDAKTVSSIQYLEIKAASLLLYQSVLQNEVGKAFVKLIQAIYQSSAGGSGGIVGLTCLKAYGQWFKTLAAQKMSWQDYLITQILRDDNPFTQQAQQRSLENITPALVTAAKHDLEALQTLYHCTSNQLSQWVQQASGLSIPPVVWHEEHQPKYEKGAIEELPLDSEVRIIASLKQQKQWADTLQELVPFYQKQGTGQLAEYRAFTWQSGQLRSIPHPDPIRLTDLVGDEFQRHSLVQNTEFLLAGLPALHVLLYGSRGTGKSSLVKALLNEYSDRGLRLIEVPKSQLKHLPIITEKLRRAPHKFIIFVDDLSFEEDDDSFKALKVALEGTLTARPPNVVVYATSNRRHLVREFFADRPRPSSGDEIHGWDTVHEKLSFSDRFGLTLTFEPPSQEKYLNIVRTLADQFQLDVPPDTLTAKALQWATRHNGRSGRSARQFIDFMRAEQSLQKMQSD
jgi:hypothetical protein